MFVPFSTPAHTHAHSPNRSLYVLLPRARYRFLRLRSAAGPPACLARSPCLCARNRRCAPPRGRSPPTARAVSRPARPKGGPNRPQDQERGKVQWESQPTREFRRAPGATQPSSRFYRDPCDRSRWRSRRRCVTIFIVVPGNDFFLLLTFGCACLCPSGYLSTSPSRSTLAWPATIVLRIEHLLLVVLGRSGPRRLLAHIPDPVPANRSPPDHSPRVLSHDPAVQCNPEGGRRTRRAHRSRFFVYPFVDRLGKYFSSVFAIAFVDRKSRSSRMEVPSSPTCSPFCVRRR